MSDLAAVVLALSAWAGAWVAAPVPLAGGALVVSVALALRRPALLCLGVALATSALAVRSRAGLQPPSVGPWSGVVTLVGDPADVYGALRVTVRVEGKRLEAWARGGRAGQLHDRLAGERVWLAGRIERLPAAMRGALASRHVAGRLSVERVGAWAPGGAVSRAANGARRTVLAGASSLSPDRRALFGGFVLGDDRGQSIEVADDFRAAGLTHLLVVSGQNVAFVLALAGPALRRLGLRSRFVVGVGVLVLFGTLTRWEPSVLRAVAMAGLALLAGSLGRPASSLRLLALAVTGLLLIDPLVAFSVGFQLSVGACAGIALFATRFERAVPGPRWLASALGVTLAAQAGVAPVLVPVFGSLPLAAVPANLLALPAAAPLSVWAMAVGLPAGLVGGAVARAAHLPTDLLLAWVAGVARVAADAPVGQLRIDHLGLLAAALAAAVAVSRLAGIGRRWLPATAVAGAALAVALPALRPGPLDGRMVAPGATVWRRGGSVVLVVDGARSPAALLTGLRSAAVRRLDVVVVTRPGPAAAAVVEPVLNRWHPGLLLAPAASPLPGATDAAAGTTARAGPLTVTVVAAEPRLEVRVTDGTAAAARGPPLPGARPGYGAAVRLALGSRNHELATRALVMGILNRTPDSFFDAGAHFALDAFCRRAGQLVDEGADILDVGGVKAGPGPEVGLDEELDRVVPGVEALHARFDVAISVDTWRSEVARAAYRAGAVMGNDISGFADPRYLAVSADAGATVVATHIRLGPRVPDPEPSYDDVVGEVRGFLVERARQAEAAGIPPERIVVDAGLDLGKTAAQSLTLLQQSRRLAELGYPLLLSASNKPFLGRLLDLAVDERRDASLAAAAIGIAGGCRIVRAHDVAGTRRVRDTLAAVLESTG